MNGTSQAILLVADISGYTKFMRLHAMCVSHAKQMIVKLLKAIMNASGPPLKVAELEGDAVFFYALSSDKDIKGAAYQVKGQVLKFFSAFKSELTALEQLKLCTCNACTHVGEMELKIVIHAGEVAIERIEKFKKLFGVDVILVHRMLKSSIPSHEYVMMTDPMFAAFVDFYGLTPERFKQEFDGIGEVETLVFYPSPLLAATQNVHVESPVPSLSKTFAWKVKMHSRTLFDLLGIHTIKGTFNNLHT